MNESVVRPYSLEAPISWPPARFSAHVVQWSHVQRNRDRIGPWSATWFSSCACPMVPAMPTAPAASAAVRTKSRRVMRRASGYAWLSVMPRPFAARGQGGLPEGKTGGTRMLIGLYDQLPTQYGVRMEQTRGCGCITGPADARLFR